MTNYTDPTPLAVIEHVAVDDLSLTATLADLTVSPVGSTTLAIAGPGSSRVVVAYLFGVNDSQWVVEVWSHDDFLLQNDCRDSACIAHAPGQTYLSPLTVQQTVDAALTWANN